MSRQARRGLTRVEVIVVAVAIFLLLGLLIPLTNSARDGGGRRGQCMNNQKQIGLAAFNYAATNNEMPPVITTFTPKKFVFAPGAVQKQLRRALRTTSAGSSGSFRNWNMPSSTGRISFRTPRRGFRGPMCR